MSIISEALKKVQEQRTNKSEDAPPKIIQGIQIPPEKKAPEPEKLKVNKAMIVLAIVLCAALAGFFIINSYRRLSSPRPTNIVIPEDSRAQAALEPLKAAPQKKSIFSARKTVSRRKLPVLSGIMYTPSNPSAILNGRAVYEGEVVNGATILRILPDRVKISSGGVNYELRMD